MSNRLPAFKQTFEFFPTQKLINSTASAGDSQNHQRGELTAGDGGCVGVNDLQLGNELQNARIFM